MSSKHLSIGSEQPPVEEGKLRLYSMEYCPYAHRARLVLRAKGLPHDVVNINLMKKPDWYFKIHPEGKVPALVVEGKVVVESLDIANYLDEKYPDPPLYPEDAQRKASDMELIKKISPLTDVFTELILLKKTQDAEEWFKEFGPLMQIFEDELEKRGSVFFNGSDPGMVDYMLWPWAERSGTVAIVLKKALPMGEDQFKKLRAWKRAMRARPEVDGIYHGPEKFYKVVLFKTAGVEPDYDSV